MDTATLDALNRASSLELFHLSTIIDRLISSPARIVEIRLLLHVGQHIRFVDWSAPGAALTLRNGTVVAMKDTQVVVRDATSRKDYTLPYAAIEPPAGAGVKPQASTPPPSQRPSREDFRVGDRVSFEDRHLQTCIGTIVRINRKRRAWTAKADPVGGSPSLYSGMLWMFDGRWSGFNKHIKLGKRDDARAPRCSISRLISLMILS